jgi:glutamyl-tRNA synthetase
MSSAPAVRVRFAPSPTGYLHVGGARTALFNWLFARKAGGRFILRVEDTDRERSTDEHTRVILEGLTWLGVTWDEGPYFQGAYAARHRADAERLLDNGKAYRCFCTKEELDARRAEAEAAHTGFRYDRRCFRLSRAEVTERLQAGRAFAIRFLVPDEEVAWDDAVHGHISFQSQELDDFVILRSDGSAIYNLAVVSDDIDMRITHVIRGDDHISNTPKQVLLYRALGREAPVFAHVPMILGTDGKKLSKRHGATAVGDYQDRGILPAAMRNFLALLGWAPGEDREILPEHTMIALFSLEAIQGKAAVFDPAKLEWMNGQYISATPAAELRALVERELARLGVAVGNRDLLPLIDSAKPRARTIIHLAELVAIRIDPARVRRDEKAQQLIQKMGVRFAASVALARETLAPVDPEGWTAAVLLDRLKGAAEANSLKLGDLLQPVRVVMTGSTVSVPVTELLAVVGREESLRRLDAWDGAAE